LSGSVYVESVSWATVVIVALVTAAPLFLGAEVYERRQYLLRLEERAAWLEREREERARRAVREERARIARELHDVAAHQTTVMTIQAAAARRVLDTRPEDALVALDAIEESGRRALTEMRRLLELLRTDESLPDLAPQPGLDGLDLLVAQMVESGLDVDLSVTGERRNLPAGIDLSAYRIVQESLTNALKHGGPDARASVLIDYGTDHLSLSIEDDGRGAAEGLTTVNGTGQGIVGMRERVSLLDGEFDVGPRAGGGYRVRVRLPI
jgi:signal transduction histidine kinase